MSTQMKSLKVRKIKKIVPSLLCCAMELVPSSFGDCYGNLGVYAWHMCRDGRDNHMH